MPIHAALAPQVFDIAGVRDIEDRLCEQSNVTHARMQSNGSAKRRTFCIGFESQSVPIDDSTSPGIDKVQRKTSQALFSFFKIARMRHSCVNSDAYSSTPNVLIPRLTQTPYGRQTCPSARGSRRERMSSQHNSTPLRRMARVYFS